MIYNGQLIYSPEYIIGLAREQRRNLTETEQIMWEELRNKQLHGFRFRCQHPIYRYISDFYCHKAMVAIEIDGDIHKIRHDYDMYRDQVLENIGIITLRFSNKEVLSNMDRVITKIEKVLLKQ
jgi:very-short-patch-repair endonuclease